MNQDLLLPKGGSLRLFASAKAATSAPVLARGKRRTGVENRVRYDEYQQRVIECNDPVIVAEAFAGSGKTTVALGFTDARPKTRFLYVCFNRANAEEARRRFGEHVDCRTTHSLAWAAIGHKYSDRVVGSWRAGQLASEMGIGSVRMAAIAQSILNAFFCSADKTIDERHALDAYKSYMASPSEVAKGIDIARVAWSAMKTPGRGISVPHDAYLKMWALSNPQLPYEHIVVDEAQDTNPVMFDVIRKQKHAKLLLIGDRHQSIYGFRKAYNAIEAFSAMGATVLKLPRTWRFNQNIANVANTILRIFKDEDTAIIGAGPTKPLNRNSPVAFLARTNFALFEEAAEIKGNGVYWIGGIESYRVDMLEDAWNLKNGRHYAVMSPSLRRYESWSQIKEEADQAKDNEMRLLCRIIERYDDEIPDLVRSFKKNAATSFEDADIIMSTAHKSKGFDFDRVVIADDFECLFDAFKALLKGKSLTEEQQQEINLLYVAMTRARHQLSLNEESMEFLEFLNTIDDGDDKTMMNAQEHKSKTMFFEGQEERPTV